MTKATLADWLDDLAARYGKREALVDGTRAAFGRFVHQVFSFRRKTLRKALAQAGFDAATALTAADLDGQQRPEMLTPEQLLRRRHTR